MTKSIAVLGATGQQGGGVVNVLLETPGWKVRAITRNVDGDKAKALAARGAEVVAANIDDEASLIKAFEVDSPQQTPPPTLTKQTLTLRPGCPRHLRRHQLLGAPLHRQIKEGVRRRRSRASMEARARGRRDALARALHLVDAARRQ